MSSPWGQIQEVRKITTGISVVTTASHGGYRISAKKAELMPEAFRLLAIKYGVYFWFEEDCASSLVFLSFELFNSDPTLVEAAHKTAKNYYPHAYKTVFNCEVCLDESMKLREEKFEVDNINNFVTIAAWLTHSEFKIPKNHVLVLAQNGKQQQHFYVPCDEYSKRSNFGFVINGHEMASI